MTKEEIIKDKNMSLECLPDGKVFTSLGGKDVRKFQLRTALFYGDDSWTASKTKNASLDSLFFHLVKKGKIEVPTDYEPCQKCGGSGNVGYNRDGGICYKCEGWGYKFIGDKNGK